MPRIKSLDGLRAVAIFLVFVGHGTDGLSVGVFDNTIIEPAIRQLGRFGVILFFVLSGYLITTLLLMELKSHGKISVRRFWFRRCFRIFPIFYAYLFVVAALRCFGAIDVSTPTLIAAATYSWNYNFLFISEPLGADWSIIGHFWTLAVEEQFYIIFPIAFLCLRPRQISLLCTILVVAAPVIRLVQYFAFPDTRAYIGIMTHTVVGGTIAFGCLLGFGEQLDQYRGVRRFLRSRAAFIISVMFAVIVHPLLQARFEGVWTIPIGESLAGLCALTLMTNVISRADDSIIGATLNSRLFIWIGTLSYSLYVWHQLFFVFPRQHISYEQRCIDCVLAVIVASMSFYCLEKPMLLLRDRLAMRKPSPAT